MFLIPPKKSEKRLPKGTTLQDLGDNNRNKSWPNHNEVTISPSGAINSFKIPWDLIHGIYDSHY